MGFPSLWVNVQTTGTVLALKIQIWCPAQKFIHPGEMLWLGSSMIKNGVKAFWPLANHWRPVPKSGSALLGFNKIPLHCKGLFSPASSVAEQQGQVRIKPRHVCRLMWDRLNIWPSLPCPCFVIICLRRTTLKRGWCPSFSCRMPNRSPALLITKKVHIWNSARRRDATLHMWGN